MSRLLIALVLVIGFYGVEIKLREINDTLKMFTQQQQVKP